MRKEILLRVCALLVAFTSCKGPAMRSEGISLEQIAQQLELLDENIIKVQSETPLSNDGQKRVVPRTINKDGSLQVVPADDWTSGFYPGVLWYMYELTGESKWKERAVKYTTELEDQQYNGSEHDVGFSMFCSYGNAFRLTGDERYIPVLVRSATTLIARYYPYVGCISCSHYGLRPV